MEAGSRCTGEDVIPQLQITQTPTSLPLLRCPLGNYGCTLMSLQIRRRILIEVLPIGWRLLDEL